MKGMSAVDKCNTTISHASSQIIKLLLNILMILFFILPTLLKSFTDDFLLLFQYPLYFTSDFTLDVPQLFRWYLLSVFGYRNCNQVHHGKRPEFE